MTCSGDVNLQNVAEVSSNRETTNLDNLAAGGFRSTRCISNYPLCSPFRSMLQTGLYPHETGVYVNSVIMQPPPSESTLPELFGNATYNYRTAYIGKWHLDGQPNPGSVRWRRGWQHWAGFNRGHQYNPDIDDPGVYWLNVHKDDTPWFMMISYGGPHGPYNETPQEYKDLYPKDIMQLRDNVPSGRESAAKTDLQGYYGHIKIIDEQIGRLMDYLDTNGLADNTLIVFTADHGDMLFSHNREGKGVEFSEAIRVPFIARLPESIPAGTVTEEKISSIDLYPTLCGLCGITLPMSKGGMDFSGLLVGNSSTGRSEVFLFRRKFNKIGWFGVRTDQYTYAWDGDTGSASSLFDNYADPYQFNNLANDGTHSAVQLQMHDLMISLMKQANDPVTEKAIAARSCMTGDFNIS